MTAQKTLTVDVVSDVVCPWCYIGKRHLEAALARWRAANPDATVDIRWHAFQLNPDLPLEGTDRKGYLEAKFGGPQRAAEIYARVGAAGKSAGLDLNFDGIKRQPNTLAAHALIAYAQTIDEGRHADAIVEQLFKAYFVEGEFIGDLDTLAKIAGDNGLDAAAVRAMLADPAMLQQIATQDAGVRQQGITGVPFFVFNQKLALSGAQPSEAMVDAMSQATA